MRLAPGDVLRSIGYLVGCDPEQPRHKRHAAPFESRQILQCEMKNLGGKILRLVAIAHPPRNVGIDALEVSLVEISKPATVPLRRLD